MLFPKSLDNLVAHKLPALSLSHGRREGRFVVTAYRNWRTIVLSRKLQNKSREGVLGLRRQTPDSLDSVVEELCHAKSIADTT